MASPIMTTVEQIEAEVNNELPAVITAHIQSTYGIALDDAGADNPIGTAATQDMYSADLGANIFPNMVSKDFALWELIELEQSLKLYAPLLGGQRNVTMGAQPITSFSRFDAGVDAIGGIGAGVALDPDTEGETFVNAGNIAMYDGSTVASDHATQEGQFGGVTAHELSHILIEETLIPSAADPTQDKKIVSEFYRATGFFDSRSSSPYWRDDVDAPTGAFDFNDVDYVRNTRAAALAAGVESPITDYGMEDANEDLAETMSYFRANPAQLRADAPIRYRFIIDRLSNMLDPAMVMNARIASGEIPAPPDAPPAPATAPAPAVGGGGAITPEALQDARGGLNPIPQWTGAVAQGGNGGGGIQLGGYRGQGANAEQGQNAPTPWTGAVTQGGNADGGIQLGGYRGQGQAVDAEQAPVVNADPAQIEEVEAPKKKAFKGLKKAFKKIFG